MLTIPGEVGTAYIRLRPNTTGFQGEASSSLKRSLVGIGAAVGGFFAAQQAVGFLKQSVQTASSIQKSQETIQATMGKSSRAVEEFGRTSANSFLISKKDSESFAARVGIMGQNIGLTGKQSANMSVELLKLAGSFGQVKGEDPTPYLTKLSSALLGNTRGLKQMGIAISSTNELQAAQRLGFIKSTVDANAVAAARAKVAEYTARVSEAEKQYGAQNSHTLGATASLKTAQEGLNKALAGSSTGTVASLTSAQKAQVIMAVATSHLSALQKEASAHSGDLANQTLRLTAEWSDAKDEVGLALLPVVTKLARVFARELPGAMHSFATSFHTAVADATPIVQPLLEVTKALSGVFFRNLKTVTILAGAFIGYKVALAGITEAQKIYKEVSAAVNVVEKILSGNVVFSTRATEINAAAKKAQAAAAQEGIAASVESSAALDAQTVSTEAATVATEELDAAFALNPFTIAIAAIAAVSVGLYELYQHSATAKAVMKAAFAEIKSAASTAFGFLRHSVFPAFIDAFEGVKTVIVAIGSHIASFWHHWGEQILGVVHTVFRPMVTTVRVVMTVIRDVIRTVLDAIHGKWGRVFHDIGNLFGDILGGIIRIAFTALGTVLKLFVEFLRNVGPVAVRIGARILKGIVNEVNNLPGQITHWLKRAITVLINDGPHWFHEAVALGKELVRGAISGVENLASGLKNALEGQIKKGLGALNPFSPVSHGGELYIASPIVAGATSALKQPGSGLSDQLVGVMNPALLATARIAQKLIHGKYPALGNGISQGVLQPLGSLASDLQTVIVSAAHAAIAGAKKALGIKSPSMLFSKQIGKPIADGILHGMGGLKAGLVSQINQAATAAAAAASSAPSGSFGPAPPGQVRDWLTKALEITGHFSPANLNALYGRTMQESSGNPHAINLTDSNAAAGHPSKGLLQTIDSTFNAYKLPGYNDIWNPIDNAIAAIRYMYADYHHIVGPSNTGYGDGGIVKGPYRGAPVMIQAHAGETILPTHKSNANVATAGVNIESLTVVSSSPHLWGQASDVMNSISRKVRR